MDMCSFILVYLVTMMIIIKGPTVLLLNLGCFSSFLILNTVGSGLEIREYGRGDLVC
jgi:hypothetical protein